MNGQTRLGMLGVATTTVLLMIYRMFYSYKLYNITWLASTYTFLQSFSITFAVILALSLVIVLATIVRNYIVEIVLFVIFFIAIELLANGIVGV